MKRNKRYGLVGIYEDYSHRRAQQSAELGCFGLHPAKTEVFSRLNAAMTTDISYIRDPFCLEPVVHAYGVEQLGFNLAYLYATLAHEWSRTQQLQSTLTTHSVLDIYAEICMYHRRQKWLEPMITRAVLDYDLLVYMPISPQKQGVEKYQNTVRKLMKMFKGKYVQAATPEEAADIILYDNARTIGEMDGKQAQPDTGDSEAASD